MTAIKLDGLATAKAIKAEEERLAERRKALEGRAERLKHYLEAQLMRVGKRKIEGTYATVALQDNPPRVQELVALEPQNRPQTGEVVGRIESVPAGGTAWFDKTLILEVANL